MDFEASIIEYLKCGVWGDRYYNPIEIDSGGTFARFDGVQVVPATDSAGGAYLRYRWFGVIVAWERVYNNPADRQKVREAEAHPSGRIKLR